MSKGNKDQQTSPERLHLSSAAMFYKLEENIPFVGKYLGDHIGQVEDPETHVKKEGVIGFDFVNDDGEEVIITNSHSIAKSLNTVLASGKMAKETPGVFEIEFLGKITNSKGKPFNRFDVFFSPDSL
jgi:hypothetical protein